MSMSTSRWLVQLSCFVGEIGHLIQRREDRRRGRKQEEEENWRMEVANKEQTVATQKIKRWMEWEGTEKVKSNNPETWPGTRTGALE